MSPFERFWYSFWRTGQNNHNNNTKKPVSIRLFWYYLWWRSLCSKRNTQARDLSPIRFPEPGIICLSPSATHKHTPPLSHNWKPTCSPKPSNRTQFLLLFVSDLQLWDVSMVHVLLHCMSGLHWLFRDVCMFACALLLTLDRLVYACLMYWFWWPLLFWIVKCFEPV